MWTRFTISPALKAQKWTIHAIPMFTFLYSYKINKAALELTSDRKWMISGTDPNRRLVRTVFSASRNYFFLGWDGQDKYRGASRKQKMLPCAFRRPRPDGLLPPSIGFIANAEVMKEKANLLHAQWKNHRFWRGSRRLPYNLAFITRNRTNKISEL